MTTTTADTHAVPTALACASEPPLIQLMRRRPSGAVAHHPEFGGRRAAVTSAFLTELDAWVEQQRRDALNALLDELTTIATEWEHPGEVNALRASAGPRLRAVIDRHRGDRDARVE